MNRQRSHRAKPRNRENCRWHPWAGKRPIIPNDGERQKPLSQFIVNGQHFHRHPPPPTPRHNSPAHDGAARLIPSRQKNSTDVLAAKAKENSRGPCPKIGAAPFAGANSPHRGAGIFPAGSACSIFRGTSVRIAASGSMDLRTWAIGSHRRRAPGSTPIRKIWAETRRPQNQRNFSACVPFGIQPVRPPLRRTTTIVFLASGAL